MFRKRCDGCGTKLKKDELLAEVRVGTADGIIVMEVCPACANFVDSSASYFRKVTDQDVDD